METIQFIAIWLVALGILNVWLLRRNKATGYRAGGAADMREEFKVYGLPSWFMYAIGTVKIAFALCLIAGVWYPALIKPAVAGMAALMAGAVFMHIKVNDSLKRTSPAIAVLLMCLIILIP